MTNCKNCKMTDEYCASGDCSNDTLMEQWKKGEQEFYLRHKDFYFNGYYAEGMLAYYQHDRIMPVNEVLAPVPSYEQWQASENYIDYLKQCISVYESKEKQHTDDAIAYNELAKENSKLKELLGECVDWLTYIDRDNGIVAKINQVLGE